MSPMSPMNTGTNEHLGLWTPQPVARIMFFVFPYKKYLDITNTVHNEHEHEFYSPKVGLYLYVLNKIRVATAPNKDRRDCFDAKRRVQHRDCLSRTTILSRANQWGLDDFRDEVMILMKFASVMARIVSAKPWAYIENC